jgi:hypothetical protein
VRFAKALGPFCISCHSDYPRRRAGSEQAWLDPLPSGIGCERCHGPGEAHVRSLRKEDVVNPARLTRARQLDVCAQCHLSSSPELRAGRHEHDFRPGGRLDEVRLNFVAVTPDPARLDLLSHTERLSRSACWKRSQMTCTTCHDPHKSSFDQPAGWWDGKCAQCHVCKQKQTAGCPGCHMRKGPPWNPPQVTVTDHWIQRRPPARLPGRPRADELTAAPASFVGEEAQAKPGPHRDEARSLAAVMQALRTDLDDRGALLRYARMQLDARREDEALRALDRLIAIDPDDAEALELEGMVKLRGGHPDEAKALFVRAAQSPAAAAAHVGLAVLTKSRAELEAAHAVEPRDTWILEKLGRPEPAPHLTQATGWLPPAYR